MGKDRTVCVAQEVDWQQDLAEEKSISGLCCNGPHNLWKCFAFKTKAGSSRQSLVKERSLCFSCLLPGYRVFAHRADQLPQMQLETRHVITC